jgi:hypothetical protein
MTEICMSGCARFDCKLNEHNCAAGVSKIKWRDHGQTCRDFEPMEPVSNKEMARLRIGRKESYFRRL